MQNDHHTNFVHFCHYLEEDIDTPLCQELLQHMEECPECKHNITTIRKTVALYRQSQSSAHLSPEIKRKLIAQLKHQAPDNLET